MAKTPSRIALLTALVSAAVLVLARGAVAGEAPIVREIVIRGFAGDPSEIKDLMRTKEGAPLDVDTLNDDTRVRLLAKGYLATTRIQDMPTGVRIILRIEEQPTIRRITVDGAGRSWNRKLVGELVTRRGSIVTRVMLGKPEAEQFIGDKDAIKRFCREHGYRDVAVKSKVAPVPESKELDLAFSVTLGPKCQVTRLRFTGNKAFSSRTLRRAMRTKQDGWLTSRRYCERHFREDLDDLRRLYRDKGFPNAKVDAEPTFHGRRRNRVHIAVGVVEGPQYHTGAITFKGNKAFPAETLLARIPLKSGDTFAREKLRKSAAAVMRLYGEEGYPFTAVRWAEKLDDATGAFDAAFEIEEGERVTVATIIPVGHSRTRRDVILRELFLEPGKPYDIRKYEASQRALDRLQFFDSVVMKLEPTKPPKPGERDLRVEVKEGKTGDFRVGVGFSTVQSVVGAIDYVQHNFDWPGWGRFLGGMPKSPYRLMAGKREYVGAGRLFRLALMPGFVYSNYLIQYNNPYWTEKQSFGWRLYYRTRDQGEWDEQRIGLRLSRGRRRYKDDPDTDLVYHARVESISVLDADEDDAPEDALDEEGSHALLGLGATLRRDRTDRRVLPTSGYKWDAGPEAVVPHGLKLGAGWSRYWSLGSHPKWHERVFSIRSRIDYALGSFPIFERYYAGGALLRGFDYRGAGPTDNDEPEGGKYRALLSAQYRYPLMANRLYGVVFCDTGTVTDDFSVFGSPRASVGAGLRFMLPGHLSRVPLRLDVSLPFLKQSDDETQAIFFSISLDR